MSNELEIEKIKQDFEVWKHKEERKIEIWKTEFLQSIAEYQSANMSGQSAMRAAMFINGGASVAILAFIGAAVSQGLDKTLLIGQCRSLSFFVTGTLLAAFAFGFTYFSNFVDQDKKRKWFWQRWGFWNALAIISVVVSYIFFLVASCNSYTAFMNLFTK